MGAGHGGTAGLAVAGTSPLHRLPPEVKIASTVLFVFTVVATPREAFWAFGLHALCLVTLTIVASLPLRLVVRRLRIELPFLAFAVFLPIVGSSPRTHVLGLSLSQAGLWGAWNILAKGTLGVSASILLAATTPIADLLRGLDRLHLPKVFTAITGFMARYLDVIAGEASRMHIARQSRGYDPRWLWQARGVAASAGTLFVRSFERGERVHLAMQARGYTGTMPILTARRATVADWATGAALPLLGAATAIAALLT